MHTADSPRYSRQGAKGGRGLEVALGIKKRTLPGRPLAAGPSVSAQRCPRSRCRRGCAERGLGALYPAVQQGGAVEQVDRDVEPTRLSEAERIRPEKPVVLYQGLDPTVQAQDGVGVMPIIVIALGVGRGPVRDRLGAGLRDGRGDCLVPRPFA